MIPFKIRENTHLTAAQGFATSTISLGNWQGTICWLPVILPNRITIDSFSIRKINTGGRTDNFSFAIYENSDGRPSLLIQELGSITPTTTAGVYTVSISNLTLNPGVYWLAINYISQSGSGNNSYYRPLPMSDGEAGIANSTRTFYRLGNLTPIVNDNGMQLGWYTFLASFPNDATGLSLSRYSISPTSNFAPPLPFLHVASVD